MLEKLFLLISLIWKFFLLLISTEQMEGHLVRADFRAHPVVQVVMEAHIVDAELELL